MKKSKIIDGQGPHRISKLIIENFNKKNLKKNFYSKPTTKKITVNECKLYDARNFMNTRNEKSNRNVSTNPKHIIKWPEHVNWWLNFKIKKYKITNDDKTLGFHWLKANKDKMGLFLTSGWIIRKDAIDKLKISLKILESQLILAKQNYRNFKWIVITKNENKFVISFNLKIGFKKASLKTAERASNIFNIDLKEYRVMEMSL